MHIGLFEHDVAAFSMVFRAFLCCMLAGKAKQRLVLQCTRNSTNLMSCC